MKITITITLFIFFGLIAAAQQKAGIITGFIKDAHHNPVTGATIRLLKTTDSVSSQAGTSDANGSFMLNHVSNGTYLLRVTALGQQSYQSPPIIIKNSSVALSPIIMTSSQSIGLATVVVNAKRRLIQTEIDRTIVNVDAMISAAGSNSLEVLEKTPGVSVNASGDITLNGKSGVMVLIDGRQTYMSGQNLSNYLKSIPGGGLDKIELLDNPPARYDASGNAIINLKLKKIKTGGLTGGLQTGYSQGQYARSNNNLNLNFNRKKLNLFGNLSYSHEKNYNTEEYDRFFYNAQQVLSSMILLNDKSISRLNGANLVTGFDYNISDNTTYGVQVNINQTRQKSDYNYENMNFSPLLPDGTGTGSSLINDNLTNWSVNANYLHKFGKSGKELALDANYLNYTSRNEQLLDNYTYTPAGQASGNSRYYYQIPSAIRVYNAKADYSYSLRGKAKIEAGVKTRFASNYNTAGYYNVIDGTPVIDNTRSNQFKYAENINSAYFSVQKAWKYIGIMGGLRLENTHAAGRQFGNAQVAGTQFIKDYTQLFPSLFINYKLDTTGRQSFNFSLSRRINRPGYQQLNPFIFIRDQYSYTSGNPLLTPQYQYRYELKYQYRQALRLGLSYNRFTDVVFRTTTVVDNVFISTPQNVGGGFMYILNLGSTLVPYPWWSSNLDMQILRLGLNGQVDGVTLNPKLSAIRGGAQNQFTLSKKLTAELGGYYISRDLNGQAYTRAMFRINGAIQLKILDGNGSIRFNIDDLFHSWVYHNYSVDLKQAKYTQVTESDTQRIGLAFTYRFGKDKFKRKSKHENNGLDDEKGRL
ncbi:TonB-dependent receptor [Mucilaginibacter sp. CSA2-8R]|uniref:TonB-dependent receptor n=1 Tax=Mucilaginibacter sp. CSA2-8R TaxID=3141542 RepID=UPI00315C53EA